MQDTTIQSPLNSSQNNVKPARAAAGAALLCVLSMSSVQFGAALSAPTMAAYGSLSTTWLRLCWAALVLALLVRPRFRSYSRSHWMAAGALQRDIEARFGRPEPASASGRWAAARRWAV